LGIAGLLADDLVGDLAVFHRESAAEAAADLGILHLDEFEAFDRAEQLARLAFDPEFAQARATVVIGYPAVEARADSLNAENIRQERDEFMGLRCELLRPPGHVRFAGEKFR